MANEAMNEDGLSHALKVEIEFPQLRPWQLWTGLALIVVDLSWAVPWYRLMMQGDAPASRWQSYAVFGSVMLAAFVLLRSADFLRLTVKARQVLLLGLLFLALPASIKLLLYLEEDMTVRQLLCRPWQAFVHSTAPVPPAFIVALVVALVWWRGAKLARQQMGPLSVVRYFRWGVIMLILNGVVSSYNGGGLPQPEFYVLLMAGLAAMGGARLDVLGRQRGGRRSPFDRRWLLGMTVVALGVILLGAAVAVMVAGPLAAQVQRLSSLALQWLARALAVILWPLALLVGKVVGPLSEWMRLHLGQDIQPLEQESLDGSSNPLVEFLHGEPLPWVDEVLAILKPVLLWVGLILVVFLLYTNLRRLALARREREGGELEFLLGPGGFSRLVGEALRRGVQGVIERVGSLRYPERRLAAARVRRIYANLMQLCADLGTPRPVSVTPLEFLQRLGRQFPSFVDELALITHAYVRVRYGELPETRQELEAVEQAWSRFRTAAEGMIRERNASLPLGGQ